MIQFLSLASGQNFLCRRDTKVSPVEVLMHKLFGIFAGFACLLIFGCGPIKADDPVADSIDLETYQIYSYLPKSNIVICSDNPEIHVKRFRKFVDYIYGEGNFEVIDGRELPAGFDPSSATLVYFGHPIEDAHTNNCLKQLPTLLDFMKLKRDTEPRTVSAFGVLPNAKRGDVLPVLATAFSLEDETEQVLTAVVGFCYVKDQLCSSAYYPVVFASDISLCEVLGDLNACFLD